MMIQRGNLYWVQLPHAEGEDARIPHPHVVLQAENETVRLCALTSNLHRASMAGNVLLEVGEGNLPKQCVVEVMKTAHITPAQLGAYIGSLSLARVAQIEAGMRFVERSFLRG
jgi:mRNA interferase MazF